MGIGIVATLAAAGVDIVAVDVSESRIAEAQNAVADQLLAALGPEPARTAGERIVWQQPLEGRPIDLAIETVPERAELKRTVITELDRLLDPSAVIATNTSQFTPSELAAGVTHRKRIAALHWFNPPLRIKLLEAMPGVDTSADTMEKLEQLATRLDCRLITCRADSRGFVTTRIYAAFVLEAVRTLEDGVATVAEINEACQLAFGHPIGPLDALDYAGLDTTLDVAEALAQSFGSRFEAPELLADLVEGGAFGRKAGVGFRTYD
jgi:3-hydroxybutyryl-CoA dehydrogenase